MGTAHLTRQSITFNGEALNLSELARELDVDASHLSRIFAGARSPSVKLARAIARRLGMDLDEFLLAIDARRRSLSRRAKALPKELTA